MSKVRINSQTYPQWTGVTGELVDVLRLECSDDSIQPFALIRVDRMPGLSVLFPLATLEKVDE